MRGVFLLRDLNTEDQPRQLEQRQNGSCPNEAMTIISRASNFVAARKVSREYSSLNATTELMNPDFFRRAFWHPVLPNNNHNRAEPAKTMQGQVRTCKSREIVEIFFEFLRFWSNFFRRLCV
jgi:hypothetical protein